MSSLILMPRCMLYTWTMLTCDFFFFNDTATTEIYTLSLHDALPIWIALASRTTAFVESRRGCRASRSPDKRSEEHTSELQSQSNVVCRLLLEKKKIAQLRARCSRRALNPTFS